jgi:hypothetical protein
MEGSWKKLQEARASELEQKALSEDARRELEIKWKAAQENFKARARRRLASSPCTSAARHGTCMRRREVSRQRWSSTACSGTAGLTQCREVCGVHGIAGGASSCGARRARRAGPRALRRGGPRGRAGGAGGEDAQGARLEGRAGEPPGLAGEAEQPAARAQPRGGGQAAGAAAQEQQRRGHQHAAGGPHACAPAPCPPPRARVGPASLRQGNQGLPLCPFWLSRPCACFGSPVPANAGRCARQRAGARGCAWPARAAARCRRGRAAAVAQLPVRHPCAALWRRPKEAARGRAGRKPPWRRKSSSQPMHAWRWARAG